MPATLSGWLTDSASRAAGPSPRCTSTVAVNSLGAPISPPLVWNLTSMLSTCRVNGGSSSVLTQGPTSRVLKAPAASTVVCADRHDHVAAPAPQVTGRHREQQADEGQVEDQVADLTQPAALGRDGPAVLLHRDPIVLAAQQLGDLGGRTPAVPARGVLDLDGSADGKPLRPRRRAGRRRRAGPTACWIGARHEQPTSETNSSR